MRAHRPWHIARGSRSKQACARSARPSTKMQRCPGSACGRERVCVCVRVCACMSGLGGMHACVRACVCVYACIYACLYMCLSMCAGMNVCRYAWVCVCVHGRAQRRRQGLRPSDTPAGPGRQRVELCAGGRRSPPVQSATRRAAGTRFSADRARSTPMLARRSALRNIAEARAHWLGSAYRSSLGWTLSFLRQRPRLGAC